MARITVEDCLDNVENRFELVLVASKRARQLARGAKTELSWDNDKPTVMALREISENLIGPDILKEETLEEEIFGDFPDNENSDTVIDTTEKTTTTGEAAT